MSDARLALLVEDEMLLLLSLESTLSAAGFVVIGVTSMSAAHTWLERLDRLDLLVCEVRRTGIDGIALSHEARLRFPKAPVIYLSSLLQRLDGREAAGARLLPKPFMDDEFGVLVDRLCPPLVRAVAETAAVA